MALGILYPFSNESIVARAIQKVVIANLKGYGYHVEGYLILCKTFNFRPLLASRMEKHKTGGFRSGQNSRWTQYLRCGAVQTRRELRWPVGRPGP